MCELPHGYDTYLKCKENAMSRFPKYTLGDERVGDAYMRGEYYIHIYVKPQHSE